MHVSATNAADLLSPRSLLDEQSSASDSLHEMSDAWSLAAFYTSPNSLQCPVMMFPVEVQHTADVLTFPYSTESVFVFLFVSIGKIYHQLPLLLV